MIDREVVLSIETEMEMENILGQTTHGRSAYYLMYEYDRQEYFGLCVY